MTYSKLVKAIQKGEMTLEEAKKYGKIAPTQDDMDEIDFIDDCRRREG